MKKYLVYLTKSYEVADRLARAFKVGEDGVEGVSHGSASNSKIPAIYHDQGYACCIVTYFEDAKVDPYRLVIA